MFQNLKKLFIYLLLLPRTFTFPINGNHGYEITTPDVDEAAVEKEIAPVLKKFENFLNTNDNYTRIMRKGEFLGELKMIIRQALENKVLLMDVVEDRGKLKHEKELADEWSWFELMRQQIEYFEENNFPQPCDDDFESKKILWNKERLKGKSNFELHEERRYQKFKYYLEHPPNEAVQKLRNRLDIANISVELFSKGVAKAYRLISDKIHTGYIKWLDKNLDEMFLQEDVLIAMGILLDEMGISKKLIKKIEDRTKLRNNNIPLICRNNNR